MDRPGRVTSPFAATARQVDVPCHDFTLPRRFVQEDAQKYLIAPPVRRLPLPFGGTVRRDACSHASVVMPFAAAILSSYTTTVMGRPQAAPSLRPSCGPSIHSREDAVPAIRPSPALAASFAAKGGGAGPAAGGVRGGAPFAVLEGPTQAPALFAGAEVRPGRLPSRRCLPEGRM